MKLPWFKSRSNPMVGVDISSSSVKLLELQKSEEGFFVRKFAHVPMKEGAMVDGEIHNIVSVSDAILSAKNISNTTLADASTAVFGNSVAIKQITIDASLNESDKESAAWVEATKHFPDIIQDLNLDFQVLGVNAQNSQLVDVLLVACRKEKIDQRVEVLMNCGLTPKVVDVDYYAMYRSIDLLKNQLLNSGRQKKIAFLHLGLFHGVLLVTQNNELVYTRSQAINGASIIDSAKEYLKVKDWMNGYISKSHQLTQDDRQALVNSIMPGLILNIRQLLQFYYSANSQELIDQVVLSGECALLPELAETVCEQLMIPTIVANPFRDIKIDQQLNEQLVKAAGPAMLVSTGLAMRGMTV